MTQHCSIIHSPNHDDRFLLCSSRCIRLFHSSNPGSSSQPGINQHILHKDFAAQKIKERQLSGTAMAYDWYPTNDGNGSNASSSDHLVAVGDQNGRVSIVNMHEASSSDVSELCASRTQRPTFFLQWNPFRKEMLAQGLDRHRNSKESIILLWDVSEAVVSLDTHGMIQHINKHSTPSMGFPQPSGVHARLDSEIPFTESLSSFTWTGQSSFVVGLGGKCLRFYELPSLKVQETVTTKSVHGLCFDRNSKNFIASFCGSQASVWMRRKLDRPVSVFSLGQDRQVLQLSWCPTRSGYLAVLGKDSRSLFVFDTIHISLSTNPDELNQSLMERHIVVSSLGSPYHLVSMAWLPAISGALVAIDSSGQLFFKQILERITVTISPAENKFFWSRGRDSGETSGKALEQDISHDMRRLALKNYGLELDKSASACAALFPEDDHRYEMWLWLEHLCALTRPMEKPRVPNNFSGRSMPSSAPTTSPYLLGVRGTINPDVTTDSGPQCSERVEAPWIHSGTPDSLPRRVLNWQYRSEERTRILRLCQLGHETIVNTIDALKNSREFERAACLALLHLDFGLAIDILRRGSEYQQRHPVPSPTAQSGLNLELIALALTGFSDERNKTWHGVARDLLPRIKHPYLKLMFTFIAAETADDLEKCTTVDGIRVVDRIALAALYLPDDKLAAFIDIMTEECKRMASLEGLVLTGLGPESLELLQAYLDRTGDVQTVSLVCLLGLRLHSSAMRKDKRPNSWANAYRDLLDGWRMWSHRANFDIQRQACDTGYRAPAQIYVACGFCGGKVMHGGQPGGMATMRRYTGNPSTASGKTSICQSCRKPLPRCAVCLMHTGTAAGMLGGATPTTRTIPFEDWFVWCLKCRHGGHTAHVAAWFKDNRDCPVSGCTCTCSELDRTSFSAVESLG